MFSHLSNYRLADPNLWQGRTDTPHPERFFQKIQFVNHEQELMNTDKKTVFVGFASDAGIIRNQGRPGAQLGPEQLKIQLAKLPCHSESSLIDLGTIVCQDDNLEQAQQQFAEVISFCHQHGHKTIAVGGGHEIAWAHYQGLAPNYPKIGIINFDAHFDLRPYLPGLRGTSGTPFSQIALYNQEHKRSFDYCCIGIQELGNTQSLFQRADEFKATYLTAEEIHQQSLPWQYAFLDEFMLNQESIYLTICLDVFAECFAPGVSAPQVLGLFPWQALSLIKYIMQSGKVISIDIAELSPPLDQDQKTARLAAAIIAELIDIY